MTEPPPRKRFQIHLSTAIVMMFVAGGLIWANTRERFEKILNVPRMTFEPDFYINRRFGWPVPAVNRASEMWITWKNPERTERIEVQDGEDLIEISWTGILIDASVVISTLSFVYFLSEWLIRRRAARKGA